MTGVSAGVAERARLAEAYTAALDDAVRARVASQIFAEVPTLWGPRAQDESARRLGWTAAANRSRELVPRIEQLRQRLSSRGATRIVLCGMGGSSLAPEVICRAAGVDLVVLDSSHPDMVRSALTKLDRTAVVVSSKSGGTVETDSQRRAFEQAFAAAGIEPAERIIIVTDPGSPLARIGSDAGYEVFEADPTVGGRYSALTAFGLVPSGLAGAPISRLLDEAAEVQPLLAEDSAENPGLRLGILLGIAALDHADKLVLADASGVGLGDWAEQLVAESTGKEGTGILPVVVAGTSSPGFLSPTGDSVLVATGTTEVPDAPWAAAVHGSLGAQFLLWETAIPVAGRILGINPFDQPDVESAKQAARELLDEGVQHSAPDRVDGEIGLFGTEADNLDTALRALFSELTSAGYLAVQAYLDRWEHADFAQVRDALAERLGRPVTFGWGPRFLHSTGQYHKGGSPHGVFLQITDDPQQDLEIPGRDFSFGDFIGSQAAGDANVLRDQGRPVLRLHLSDTAGGLARLRSVLA